MELAKTYTSEDERFLRSVTFPEEDRQQYWAKPYDGGYRWFRSRNVVDLQNYRSPAEKARIRDVLVLRVTR
jgi:hypothetical protein